MMAPSVSRRRRTAPGWTQSLLIAALASLLFLSVAVGRAAGISDAPAQNRKLRFDLSNLVSGNTGDSDSAGASPSPSPTDDVIDYEGVFDGVGTETDGDGEIENDAASDDNEALDPGTSGTVQAVGDGSTLCIVFRDTVDPIYALFEESRAAGDSTTSGSFIKWMETHFADCNVETGWCRGNLEVFSSIRGLSSVVQFDQTLEWRYNQMTRVFEVKTDIPQIYTALTNLLQLAMVSDNVVESWSENFEIGVLAAPIKSLDALFGDQWGLSHMGVLDNTNTSSWRYTTGSRSVVVAVIDTGVDYTHPDLANNMWVNVAERDGRPGVDDDGNGYVDDIYGYDFINNDGDPMDDHGHGTHCAGIIGAEGNNGIGISGVSQKVQLMALKVLPESGAGSLSYMVRAVDYALRMGAHITSNSYGGPGEMSIFKSILASANKYGQLFVSAAGNESNNIDINPMYPASYDSVINVSVAASKVNGKLASFSNYGAREVDVAAPGKNILSTHLSHKYRWMSGTSMACPMVAGAAALMLAALEEQGLDISIGVGKGFGREVRNSILNTAVPDERLTGLVATGGHVNAGLALIDLLNTEGLDAPRSSSEYLDSNGDGILDEDENSIFDGTDSSASILVRLARFSARGTRTWLQRVFAG